MLFNVYVFPENRLDELKSGSEMLTQEKIESALKKISGASDALKSIKYLYNRNNFSSKVQTDDTPVDYDPDVHPPPDGNATCGSQNVLSVNPTDPDDSKDYEIFESDLQHDKFMADANNDGHEVDMPKDLEVSYIIREGLRMLFCSTFPSGVSSNLTILPFFLNETVGLQHEDRSLTEYHSRVEVCSHH